MTARWPVLGKRRPWHGPALVERSRREENTVKQARKLLAVLLAAVLLLLAGCGAAAPADAAASEAPAAAGREDAEPTPTEAPAPEEPEPAEPSPAPEAEPGPFSADYDYVWETLETDYPYLDYLRGKGVKVDEIRDRFAAQAREAQNAEELADILDKMFYALRNTAHLSLITRDIFPQYYACYVDEVDPFHEPWGETLEAAAQAGYYELPAEPDGTVGGGNYYFPPVKVTYYADCSTLCITAYSFLHEIVERDRDVIWKAIAEYPEAKNIVFDISSNGGGDDNYWMYNIVAPFGEDYSVNARLFYRDTPRNRYVIDRPENEWWLKNFPTAEAEDPPTWALELGLDRYCLCEQQIKGVPLVQSEAKRWVLVSGTVYSAAESFVCFCKATGWATVIGRQTGGDGMGFDPQLYLLPDSGLLYRFTIYTGENPDGTMSIEGTVPDVELKAGSIGFFLDYIRSEQNG